MGIYNSGEEAADGKSCKSCWLGLDLQQDRNELREDHARFVVLRMLKYLGSLDLNRIKCWLA